MQTVVQVEKRGNYKDNTTRRAHGEEEKRKSRRECDMQAMTTAVKFFQGHTQKGSSCIFHKNAYEQIIV